MVLAPAAESSRGSVSRNRASLEAGRRLAGDRDGAEDEGSGDDDELRADSAGEVEAEAGCAMLSGPSSPAREEGAGKPPSPLVAFERGGAAGPRRGRRRGAAEGREGGRSRGGRRGAGGGGGGGGTRGGRGGRRESEGRAHRRGRSTRAGGRLLLPRSIRQRRRSFSRVAFFLLFFASRCPPLPLLDILIRQLSERNPISEM